MEDIVAPHRRLERTVRCLAIVAAKAGVGVAVMDRYGTVRYVNEAWARMHGYKTKAELIGRQISTFHTDEQMRADVIPFIEEVKRRGRLCGPVEHVRGDGTKLPTETTMIMLEDAIGKRLGLIIFATDISEHKRAKEQLNAYRNLFQHKAAELARASEQLRHEITARENSEFHLRQKLAELTTANRKLQDRVAELKRQELEMLQDVVDAEQPRQRVPALDPEELKALSNLAKHLR